MDASLEHFPAALLSDDALAPAKAKGARAKKVAPAKAASKAKAAPVESEESASDTDSDVSLPHARAGMADISNVKAEALLPAESKLPPRRTRASRSMRSDAGNADT